jgi:hypothetical protein
VAGADAGAWVGRYEDGLKVEYMLDWRFRKSCGYVYCRCIEMVGEVVRMILRMSRVYEESRRYVDDISGMRMVMRIERHALPIERLKAFSLPG